MTTVNDELLAVERVAQRVGVSTETVKRWLRDGKLRGTQPGGGRAPWRVWESDLRAFLDETASRPTSAAILQPFEDLGRATGEEDYRRDQDAFRVENADVRWLDVGGPEMLIRLAVPDWLQRPATAAFRNGYCSPQQHIPAVKVPTNQLSRPS